MTLKEFRDYIQSFPKDTKFNYGVSYPFSWRGIYDEVAFELLDEPMTRESMLYNINAAYVEIFTGYKGGEFRYDDDTPIHFEDSISEWTDGEYCLEWVAKIKNEPVFKTHEEHLVKVAFQ